MWSFVAQNFYLNNSPKTRRSVAIKKVYWSDYYPVLVKYNSTQFNFKSIVYTNTYYWIYNSIFSKSFWSLPSNITYANQGIIYNNLTLSYYFRSIEKISVNKEIANYRSGMINSRHYLESYDTLSLPFIKTTFNSLVYLSYFLLTSYYITHPMWFKLLHTYTWVNKFFYFDIALNTFYFKIYKY
jgi:hypothetical protein